MHAQLSVKLEKLDESELRKVEDSLVLLIDILDIQDIDASPMITTDVDLQ